MRFWPLTIVLLAWVASGCLSRHSSETKEVDPAAWGSDHADKPVPEYVTGDECLFCHREKVGPTWGANPHNLTIRALEDKSPALAALEESSAKQFASEVKFVMGDRRRQRFLRSGKEYGKLDLLSVEWIPPQGQNSGKLASLDTPRWDTTKFADSCAGCHATAVEPKEKAFSAVSLDCYVCHGNVPAEHPNKPDLAYLSPHRKDDPKVVISICAQCHVRSGKSKSTGRPYPTNFVAGDNLFRDFQVDLSEDGLRTLNPTDRHIMENVREVAVLGNSGMTCLSCHDIHRDSSKMHRLVAKSDLCLICHTADGSERDYKPLLTHSKTCDY